MATTRPAQVAPTRLQSLRRNKLSLDSTATESSLCRTRKAALGSRERGRRYRERLRSHFRQLQRDVGKLREHVRELKILADLQHQLTKSPPHVANAVLSCVSNVLAIKQATMETDDDPGSVQRTPLRFFIASLALNGSRSSPIVVVRGQKQGTLPLELIHRLYFCVPGNSALLDRLVDRELTFTTTRTMYFDSDGALARDVDETDYVSVLATIPGTATGCATWCENSNGPTTPLPLGTLLNECRVRSNGGFFSRGATLPSFHQSSPRASS